jgi:hypothetical protein
VRLPRIYSLRMSAYKGQARIIGDNDTDVPVKASLTSYPDGLHTSWGGTLTPAPGGLPSLANLTKGRLQLPDGTEAEFLRPDTSDWVSTQQLKIIGQDSPPF